MAILLADKIYDSPYAQKVVAGVGIRFIGCDFRIFIYFVVDEVVLEENGETMAYLRWVEAGSLEELRDAARSSLEQRLDYTLQ